MMNSLDRIEYIRKVQSFTAADVIEDLNAAFDEDDFPDANVLAGFLAENDVEMAADDDAPHDWEFMNAVLLSHIIRLIDAGELHL